MPQYKITYRSKIQINKRKFTFSVEAENVGDAYAKGRAHLVETKIGSEILSVSKVNKK